MLRSILLCLLGLLVTSVGAESETERKKAELEQLRETISSLQSDIERRTRQRGEAQDSLRRAELEVARTRTSLHDTGRLLAQSQARQREISARKQALQKSLAGHSEALAAQLRAAYISGRQEKIRLLLNQENPATLGRVMAYYGYLNRQRVDLLNQIETGLVELHRLDEEAGEQTARLLVLERQRRQEFDALESARRDRATALLALDSEIDSAGKRLETMHGQEQELQALLEQLTRALAEMPVETRTPFAGTRGQLPWPLQGRIINDFGQSRAGGRLRWQGVMLAADRGTDVKAIYHGRVAYAGWLPGMGMLLVLEHGDGYLSLYGHNEALYREVGDWVETGEVIGSVGDSGGSANPALYFEIRQGTRPINPHQWVAKR